MSKPLSSSTLIISISHFHRDKNIHRNQIQISGICYWGLPNNWYSFFKLVLEKRKCSEDKDNCKPRFQSIWKLPWKLLAILQRGYGIEMQAHSGSQIFSQEGLLPESSVLSMWCVTIEALLYNLNVRISLLTLALLSKVSPQPPYRKWVKSPHLQWLLEK